MALRRPFQSTSAALRRWNLPAGSRISTATESSSIPRNVIIVVGPSTLSGATGRPSRWHRGTAVSIASWHETESDGLQKKKSWTGWAIPEHTMAQARPSATALNTLGADRKPNGSALST